MRIILILIFFTPIKVYAYSLGFKTLPIKSVEGRVAYYLKPLDKVAQNFLVVECIGTHKSSKSLCEVFSSTLVSLPLLKAVALDLEKWDSYYLGLDIAVFVGVLFQKIRSWIWKNPIGRVVGALALAGEIKDFSGQISQGVAYAVIVNIDQKQLELKGLGVSPFSGVSESAISLQKGSDLLFDTRWVFLQGFDSTLIKRLLKLLGNT